MITSDVPAPARTTGPTAAAQVAFCSILYGDAHPAVGDGPREQPEFFVDLNLDQVVAAMTAGREGYDLLPFLHTPLHTVEQVRYRQQVLADLADGELAAAVRTFAAGMRTVRDRSTQASRMRYACQRAGWVLEAVTEYGSAVQQLADALTRRQPAAPGWRGLCDYLAAYTTTDAFRAPVAEARDLTERLADITYCVRIVGGMVTVTPSTERTTTAPRSRPCSPSSVRAPRVGGRSGWPRSRSSTTSRRRCSRASPACTPSCSTSCGPSPTGTATSSTGSSPDSTGRCSSTLPT